MFQPAPLANVEKARIMVFRAHTLPEVKRIRDAPEAARVYARAWVVNPKITPLRFRSWRRAGQAKF
jgi:hypothetical protein